ncbi:DddA-like double-stranded DNA deaminase toxin [Saccharopolyspora sp. NPDC002578]
MEEVDRRLTAVLGRLDEATEQITAAGMASAESRDALTHALAGASAPDALDAVRSQEMTVDQLAEVRATVRAVRKRVTAYLSRLGASSGPAAARTPEPTAVPKRSPNAVGVDGSEYPPEAAWAVPELPPRVRGFPDRTVGKLKIGDRPIPGEFRSGQTDVWVGEAEQRIKALGIRAPRYLAFHVELRAAAMMIRSGLKSTELLINHVPCGYQNRPPGCHQVLESFLPEGFRMTVSGTDRNGRPYRRTYHGKATQ